MKNVCIFFPLKNTPANKARVNIFSKVNHPPNQMKLSGEVGNVGEVGIKKKNIPFQGMFAKNERGYRLAAKKKSF